MKKVLFLTTALIMSTMMWAGEVTMAYSGSTTGNMTGGNDAATVGLDASSWSVVGDKGGNNNFPGLNKAGQIRLYGSSTNHNTITVTNLDEDNISSIKVKYATSHDKALVTVDGAEVTGTGEATDKTYSINSSSFTITHNYTDNTQVYILSIVITTGGITPQRTLQSIYIAGEATELEYFVGESFDPAGLKVMGVYDSGEDTEITAGIDWLFDPEIFALDDESVDVLASVGEFTSEVFTVNNIVVTERPLPSGNVDTIFIKGFAGSEATAYVTEPLEGTSSFGISAVANNFNPSTAQIKGNQTSSASNFYIYNTAAYPAAIVKIEVIAKLDDSNFFKNNMYAATGTSSQADVTDVQDGTAWDLATASWTFDKADGITYFKLYSNEKFTNGSIKEAKVVVTYSDDTPTAMQEVMENANVSKQLINGQLIIIRDNVRYNVAGQQL